MTFIVDVRRLGHFDFRAQARRAPAAQVSGG